MDVYFSGFLLKWVYQIKMVLMLQMKLLKTSRYLESKERIK